MNKRGFTLVEILAVIVILGILSTIATVSVSRYREAAREREKISLRQNIIASFDNFRSDAKFGKINAGYNVNSFEIHKIKNQDNPGEDNPDDEYFKQYFDLSYDGTRFSVHDNVLLSVNVFVKGNLLGNANYTNNISKEEQYVKDGVCLVKGSVSLEGKDTIVKNECYKDGSKIVPSNEELFCITLELDGNVLFNDYNDSNSLCRYFDTNKSQS